ncbi:MAG TPA: 3-oxoacyl-[acyl-carrier-protein] synthase III C-terminal domain-containing protein [Verrucomicrobiae bacterium]
MFISGLGTAAPIHRYEQAQCWATLQASERFALLTPRSRAILRKVLTGNNGIRTRHFAMERLGLAFELTPDALHARFLSNAPLLAAHAACHALADARVEPRSIDAVIVSTCTGYLCPGLTSYVGERLGLRPDVLALDLVGQGCGAALPNLSTAEALLSARRCDFVLSVCVEICSAAFYLDDDPGVLISACLFGDGAGAAVLAAAAPEGRRRVAWKTGASVLNPGDRDVLRFEQKNGMLRNVLTPQVPAKAAAQAERVFHAVLARDGLRRDQVVGWILHPGGRDVLLALRERLGLSAHDVRWSEAVLAEYGNMSSPSVLFVLQSALADAVPDGLWWMSAFGAGFSSHGAMLEVG